MFLQDTDTENNEKKIEKRNCAEEPIVLKFYRILKYDARVSLTLFYFYHLLHLPTRTYDYVKYSY